ncbi:unnamed protein product, partial [Iphiclides podalirius]
MCYWVAVQTAAGAQIFLVAGKWHRGAPPVSRRDGYPRSTMSTAAGKYCGFARAFLPFQFPGWLATDKPLRRSARLVHGFEPTQVAACYSLHESELSPAHYHSAHLNSGPFVKNTARKKLSPKRNESHQTLSQIKVNWAFTGGWGLAMNMAKFNRDKRLSRALTTLKIGRSVANGRAASSKAAVYERRAASFCRFGAKIDMFRSSRDSRSPYRATRLYSSAQIIATPEEISPTARVFFSIELRVLMAIVWAWLLHLL